MFENETQNYYKELLDFQIYASKKSTLICSLIMVAFAIFGIVTCFFDLSIGLFLTMFFGVMAIIFPATMKRTQKKIALKMVRTNYYYTDCLRSKYSFLEDEIDYFELTNENEVRGSAKIKYSQIVKVVETNKYFFVYVSSIQAHILQKGGMTKGSAIELSNFLKDKLGEKYKLDLKAKI